MVQIYCYSLDHSNLMFGVSIDSVVKVLSAQGFLFQVTKRRPTTVTSSGRWTPSWSGPAWSGDRSRKKIPKCTIPKFQRDSGQNGKRWRSLRSGRSSTRRRGSGQSTWQITPTTSTGQEGSPRIWRPLGTPTRCPTHLCQWMLSEQVSNKQILTF